MKKSALAFFLLVVSALVKIPAQESGGASQTLSNDSVVKLVKAGLSEATIINAVDAQPGDYSLGADDIISLKKAGVSEKIITAMLSKSGAARPGPNASNEPKRGLASIHKVFIKGNNEAATTMRSALIKRAESGAGSCLGLAMSEKTADGTLELSQDTASNGLRTVSGTLSDRDGNVLWSHSENAQDAWGAAAFLGVRLLNEICPPTSLAKVRKIEVVDPGHLKTGAWTSECLTFVETSAEADAVLLPKESGGKLIWALMDPKGSAWIPGWETDSFPDIKELEKAVGCPH